jgi:hypothetical protein
MAPTSVAVSYLDHTPFQLVLRAETGEALLPVEGPEPGKNATGCPKIMFTVRLLSPACDGWDGGGSPSRCGGGTSVFCAGFGKWAGQLAPCKSVEAALLQMACLLLDVTPCKPVETR